MVPRKKIAVSKKIGELVHAKRFPEIYDVVQHEPQLNIAEPEIAEAFVLLPFSEDVTLVRAFVEKGVPIDTSFRGLGILHVAVGLPNPEFVSQMMALGPNLDLNNSDKASPLISCVQMLAKCRGEKECLRPIYRQIATILLDAGAQVNHADTFLWTSLDYACKAEDDKMAEILLNRGADVRRCSNDGNDAFWNALRAIGTNLLSLLLKHGTIPRRDVGPSGESTMVSFAAQQGFLDKVQLLVENGASSVMADGSDALKFAAEYEELRQNMLRKLGLI